MPQITFFFPLLFYRLESSIAIRACEKEALDIFKINLIKIRGVYKICKNVYVYGMVLWIKIHLSPVCLIPLYKRRLCIVKRQNLQKRELLRE